MRGFFMGAILILFTYYKLLCLLCILSAILNTKLLRIKDWYFGTGSYKDWIVSDCLLLGTA